ncbi:MAG: hypothetical protein JXA95_14860 [Spirochaetales bacterium]|nr:hypothetical protein [Spirochaetales bacterium]
MKHISSDIIGGMVSFILTALFIVTALADHTFFEWVFNRHHNQLSWYIRPLFLIPFCLFSYKRSITGIGITILALFTSMFWFPAPEAVSERVNEFLAMEMTYLLGAWDLTRIIFTLAIPVTFFLLGYALWKRELKAGLSVVVLMAFIKIVWSIMEGGDSGTSVLVPAISGLIVCIALIYAGYGILEKRNGRER